MKQTRLTQAVSDADLTQMLLAQRVLNYLREPGSKPITLPLPFERRDPNSDVSPQRRAELEAQLERRSVFRSR